MRAEDVREDAEFRTSPLLSNAGFRHAFFTRNGGVSAGAYSSLNFSISVGDSEENVSRNLERGATALGVAASRVYFLSQVHGRVAHVVHGTESFGDVVRIEGDALVGESPHAAVGVRVADCVPILVGDLRSGAAAAIHAGWRGLVGGVVEAAVEKLRELVGSPLDAVAAIGPHIGVSAFEVGSDVAEILARSATDESVVRLDLGPKPHVSLVRVARSKLRACGLSDPDIDVVPGCTYDDERHFYSFRRDGARSGRHLAAIVPRPPTGTRA